MNVAGCYDLEMARKFALAPPYIEETALVNTVDYAV
jgi:hypothetical protein